MAHRSRADRWGEAPGTRHGARRHYETPTPGHLFSGMSKAWVEAKVEAEATVNAKVKSPKVGAKAEVEAESRLG